jgi:hypothetical protein
MTDEIDIMKKALAEYSNAVRLKRLNQELFDHLLGSVIWILKYSEKYGVPIPHRDEIFRMIQKSDYFLDRILDNIPPDFKHPNGTPDKPIEPIFMI